MGPIEMFSSRLVTTETDVGYPVLCLTSTGNKIQVAVVVGNIENYSMFASVSLSYQWIQQNVSQNEFLQSTPFKPWRPWETLENRPSGSAQGPSPHQHSGLQPNLSGHQHRGSHQRPPSPVRLGSSAVYTSLANTTQRLHQFPKVSFHYQLIQNQLANETQNNLFHAYLVIVKFKKGNQKKSCSGSVINRQFVLTAAHCFYTDSSEMFDAGQTKVNCGFYNTRNSSNLCIHNKKQAKQFIPHEEYRHDSPERARYDIGLVKLPNRATFGNYLRPISLADSVEKLDLSRCLWAGWPYIHYNNIVNQNISLEFSETLSPQIFTSRPGFPFPFENQQNQGGPVLCPTKSDPKHLEQVAVAIDTNRNGYRYLEVPFHLRWIQSIIGS